MENKAASPSQSDPPEFDFAIIDGAAFISALTQDENQTFKEYAAQKFMPRITKVLSNVLRIDVIFDVYLESSLKNSVRLHCEEGSGKRVKDNYKVPTNWKAFLRHSENKANFFVSCKIWTRKFEASQQAKAVFTLGSEVLCSPEEDTSGLESCKPRGSRYEDIFSHARPNRETRFESCTVDTDVVVLRISAVSQRDALKLFIAFGTQKNFRYINVNDLAIFLGNEKSKVLPIFHAFTSCHTVSFFAGRGKKSAMDTWSPGQSTKV